MDQKNNCLLCGAPLEYYSEPLKMTCAVCHKEFDVTCACSNGHYVCDRCHLRGGAEVAAEYCRRTDKKDPVAIMQTLMREPCIHLHGPEHHVLVGASLLAAYHNCGGELDLDRALREMVRRGKEVPGGACGFWGCCGAAVSAGIYVSLLTGATPLSESEWSLSNAMTAAALSRISALGGPRCCKRDSFAAVEEAALFTENNFGVKLELPERILCGYGPLNAECTREKCPYYPVRKQ